tara:strand:- start:384 stop:854 length:471 start_codon:yes stop_codon:yes gene_type:complete
MESKPFKMKNPSLAKAMREGTPMQLNYGSPMKDTGTPGDAGPKKRPRRNTMKEDELIEKQEQRKKADEVSYDKKAMNKKGKTRIPGTNIYEDKENKELQQINKDSEERSKLRAEKDREREARRERIRKYEERNPKRSSKKASKGVMKGFDPLNKKK